MCNLYSITKGQAAIIEFTRAMRDMTGNLPPLPGIFPDYKAPVVANRTRGADVFPRQMAREIAYAAGIGAPELSHGCD